MSIEFTQMRITLPSEFSELLKDIKQVRGDSNTEETIVALLIYYARRHIETQKFYEKLKKRLPDDVQRGLDDWEPTEKKEVKL